MSTQAHWSAHIAATNVRMDVYFWLASLLMCWCVDVHSYIHFVKAFVPVSDALRLSCTHITPHRNSILEEQRMTSCVMPWTKIRVRAATHNSKRDA